MTVYTYLILVSTMHNVGLGDASNNVMGSFIAPATPVNWEQRGTQMWYSALHYRNHCITHHQTDIQYIHIHYTNCIYFHIHVFIQNSFHANQWLPQSLQTKMAKDTDSWFTVLGAHQQGVLLVHWDIRWIKSWYCIPRYTISGLSCVCI